MEKLRYITPVIVITDLRTEIELMGTSLENYAGGVSTKDRDLFEDEEAAAADDASKANKYSLW